MTPVDEADTLDEDDGVQDELLEDAWLEEDQRLEDELGVHCEDELQ